MFSVGQCRTVTYAAEAPLASPAIRQSPHLDEQNAASKINREIKKDRKTQLKVQVRRKNPKSYLHKEKSSSYFTPFSLCTHSHTEDAGVTGETETLKKSLDEKNHD